MLGKTTLPAVALVLFRMVIVTVVLSLLPRFWRAVSALASRALAPYGLIGVVVALHWITFYGAIRHLCLYAGHCPAADRRRDPSRYLRQHHHHLTVARAK